jgi:hypothetical protein
VHGQDGDHGRARDADLLRDRADLLGAEALELLGGLPDVGDADPVLGCGDPVKQASVRRRIGRMAYPRSRKIGPTRADRVVVG